MKLLPITLRAMTMVLLTGTLATPALAQYVWTDAKGSKQYSDMPPPSSVPNSHILKRPGTTAVGGIATRAPVDDDGSTAPGELAVKTGAPMTVAERNADYQKRKIEQAEKEKKQAEAARVAAEKNANCEKIQNYNRTLEDGMRISRVDKDGERAFLTDEQREAEIRKNQRALKDCK